MATKLKRLMIDRVDLVDKGANPGAHVMLFKRDTAAAVEKAMTLQERLDAQEARDAAWENRYRVTDLFMEVLSSLMDEDDPAEKTRVLTESAQQYVEMMTQVQEVLSETEEVMMAEKAIKKTEGEVEEPTMESLQAQINALTAERDDAQQEAETAKADLAKAQGTADPEAEIWKGASPALRKLFEEREAERKRDAAIVKSLQEERKRDAAIAKAATYGNLPINPDDDADAFMALDGLDADVSKKVYSWLAAGDAAFEKAGLTREKGLGGSGDEPTDALGKMNVIAKGYVDSGTVKNMADAIGKAADENPALYAEYLRELNEGGR